MCICVCVCAQVGSAAGGEGRSVASSGGAGRARDAKSKVGSLDNAQHKPNASQARLDWNGALVLRTCRVEYIIPVASGSYCCC